jgi:hypothetical protein
MFKNKLFHAKLFSCKETLRKNFSIKQAEKVFEFTNKNIFQMRKFTGIRNKLIKFELSKCNLILDTMWSDFAHISVLDKDLVNSNIREDINYLQVNDDNNTVFQDDNYFIDYLEETYFSQLIVNEEEEERNLAVKLNNGDSEKKLSLIGKIPQEINLEIKTDSDVSLFNSGYSKLVADKGLYFAFTENSYKKTINFEAKRLRAGDFYLFSKANLVMNVKSYIETKNLLIICEKYTDMRIKKLGVVGNGKIEIKEGNCKINSIYGPVYDKNELMIENKRGDVEITNLQGNISLKLNEGDLLITNVEGSKMNLELSAMKRVELFFSAFKTEARVNINSRNESKKLTILINKEINSALSILSNGKEIYKKNKEKFQEENLSVLSIISSLDPEIKEISSWEYLKSRILNKEKIKL